MYNFRYKYFKAKYDNCAKFLFTDKDSLVYKIETNNVDENFYKNKNLFDFSDYSGDSELFDPFNKKIIGKWKMKSKEK